MPRQKLGQYFLKNAAALGMIVDALALANGDRVIEIGPGHGELTGPLAHAALGKQCEIFSIEKDHALIGALEVDAAARGITIIEGDALKLLPDVISRFPQGAHYKIVGNIPYYITGKLLRVIGELKNKPERIVLLIQEEVAERIWALPPTMNRLAASVQFWADATIIARLPRKDFSPPPEVDSAVILLKSKKVLPDLDPALYYRAVRTIFAQPRKTLLNNLSAIGDGGAKKKDISSQLANIGIAPTARPQDLDVRAIVAIAKAPLWG